MKEYSHKYKSKYNKKYTRLSSLSKLRNKIPINRKNISQDNKNNTSNWGIDFIAFGLFLSSVFANGLAWWEYKGAKDTTDKTFIRIDSIVKAFSKQVSISDSTYNLNKRTSKTTFNKMDTANAIQKEASSKLIQQDEWGVELGNRAIIIVDTGNHIGTDTKTHNIANLNLNFRNTGRTPAYDINVSFFCGTDSTGKNSSFHKFDGGTLGGNTWTSINVGELRPTCRDIEYWSGKKHIYIKGSLLYRDFFRKHHYTDFFYEWVPVIYNSPKDGDIVVPMKSHNNSN